MRRANHRSSQALPDARPGLGVEAAAMRITRRTALAAICLGAAFVSAPARSAADRLRLAVQKTGSFAWDRAADLDLDVTELASTEAGQIALMGGSADLIVSDWLWVSRERGLGRRLSLYPYSSALGALMVPAKSSINSLADLAGKKLAVAGGPLDKSWLLLQAFAARQGIDLAKRATILYGTPALLAEKAREGEVDATLNFWTFCVRLEAQGFKRLVAMEDVEKSFGATGPVAMVGYAFDEDFADKHRDALRRFFAITQKAKEMLAASDDDWQKLAPRIGTTDPAELALYRKAYAAGIPHRPIAEQQEDARKLYRILAELGGTKLVGSSPELVPGTFYMDSEVN
jgi:NitT/TauT family transport system substrate-binding protein